MMFEKKLYLVLLFNFLTHDLHALVFERRKLIKDDIFEYYIVPAVVERSGVGRLYGLGVVLNNISVPWIDNGKFNLIGGFGKGKGRNHFEDEDIDAYTLVIVDFPIFSQHFYINEHQGKCMTALYIYYTFFDIRIIHFMIIIRMLMGSSS